MPNTCGRAANYGGFPDIFAARFEFDSSDSSKESAEALFGALDAYIQHLN
jgi:hypothetical protein